MMTMINHLYIHVPFCRNICYYCDFCHSVYNKDLVSKWLKQVSKEIIDKCKNQYKTIYIGGGTPNSLDNDELDALLSFIQPYSNQCTEYTIELNPECFNIEQINLFKKYHINRFSIGIESTHDDELKILNRKHSYQDAVNLIKILKNNGFNNISIDLMYSLPNQTMEDLSSMINNILDLDIPHISIYSLTIEDNSVFGKKGIKNLDEEQEGIMYEYIHNKLTSHGYIHYEVSNFSKKGFESKHNFGYWDYDDYLGISLSASSKIGNHRYTTTRSFYKYLDNYSNKDEDLLLSLKDLIIENTMMSLRTNKGISLTDFKFKYNLDFKEIFACALNRFKEDFVYYDDNIVCKNMAILNHILSYFYIDLDNYFEK